MKSITAFGLFTWMMFAGSAVNAQKAIAEGTLVYNILIKSGNSDTRANNKADSAVTTVYLKGNLSRTDMSSALGSESTILDSKTGSGVILKEYSGQKLMITLTKENWAEKNKKYESLVFTESGETKNIAGYNCKMAVAKLNDGNLVLFYTTELVPANKEYAGTFKNLPGLAVQYEFQTSKSTYTYTLAKINFDVVAASRFDIPKSGYRVMTYEENKQIKKGE
jgi:GLPGLI family protein